MAAAPEALVAQLRAAGVSVAEAGAAAYLASLASIDMWDAAVRHPVAVAAPRSAAEVASVLTVCAQAEVAVTVRGGGHSSMCAADDSVLVDLAQHLDRADPSPDATTVRVAGGATMGTVLRALDPHGRVVPIGAALDPGVGLVLHGGVGALSRRFGLALDQIVGVELVLPDGRIVELDDGATGDDAELWWAVRGAAPNLGVVTAVTLRTRALDSIALTRHLLDPEAVGPMMAWAEGQPRHRSTAMVLATDPGGQLRLLVLSFTTAPEADERGWRDELDEVVASTGSIVHHVDHRRCRYVDQPPLAIPDLDGDGGGPPDHPLPLADREATYVTSRLLGAGRDPHQVGQRLVEAMRRAPTPQCRIDLQLMGGAVADVDRTATPFWNRDAEWNVPIAGAWPASSAGRDEAERWARTLAADLDDVAVGAYVVDARPDRPDMANQVAQAFGDNLDRLARCKELADPDRLLSRYYRVDPPG